MEVKPRFRSFVMYAALLIALLGLISMVFELKRSAFVLEFLILLGLLLMALVSFVGLNSNVSWVWKLLAVFFAFVFIDMAFIYVVLNVRQETFFYNVFAVIAGFFISFFSIEKQSSAENEVKKTFKPGKFIASRAGTKFHAPKCDWAKKIKKENAVWFNNKEDARKAGYKTDDCVN